MRRTSLNKLGIAALAGSTIAGCQFFQKSYEAYTGGASTTSSGSSSSNGSSSSGSSSSGGGTGGLGGAGGTMATGGSPGGLVEWANSYGTMGDAAAPQQAVTGIAVDKSGNVFVVGWFSGAIDLGMGCSTDAGTTKQGFVVKLDPQGQCLKSLFLSSGGSKVELTAVTVDESGNVFVGGTFTGTITLPAQPSQSTAVGAPDAFVASYDNALAPAGKWSTIISGVGDETIHALAVGPVISNKTTLYVASSFSTDVDVTFAAGSFSTPLGAAKVAGLALAVDTATGNVSKSRVLGTAGETRPLGIASDLTTNKIVIAGTTNGSITFSSSGTPMTATGGDDAFLVSYDNVLGTSPSPGLYGDNPDQSGNAVAAAVGFKYVTGTFHGKMTGLMPPLPGNAGGDDIYLANVGGSAPHVVTLGVDTNPDMKVGGVVAGTDSVVLAGTMAGTNPKLEIDGNPEDTFTTMGTRDIFVIKFGFKLDKTVWRRTLGGAGIDYDVSALSLGPNGEIYIAGGYTGAFNLGLKTAVPGNGIFVAQLKAN